MIETIGRKNADFQITNFKYDSQPYYLILNYDGNILQEAMSLMLKNNEKIDFVKNGIQSFHEAQNL